MPASVYISFDAPERMRDASSSLHSINNPNTTLIKRRSTPSQHRKQLPTQPPPIESKKIETETFLATTLKSQ